MISALAVQPKPSHFTIILYLAQLFLIHLRHLPIVSQYSFPTNTFKRLNVQAYV